MVTRSLGRTAIAVPAIGFGTWGLGGNSYGPIDEAAACALVRAAVDRGVTFFDTSDLYGAGRSEAVLGRALEGLRPRAVIATKVGMLPHEGFDVTQNFEPRRIPGALRASLSRLRTDHVDLYQLHSPPLDVPNWPEVLDVLARLRAAGSIRAIGLSARHPREALGWMDRFAFDAIQVNFNLIDHRAIESGLLRRCRREGVAVIARTPLCFGFLAGTLTGDETFGPDDHRSHWPREQLRRWATAPAVFGPLARREACSLVQLALRFCLAPSTVATTIPGIMGPADLHENASAADLPPLRPAVLRAIRRLYRSHVFFEPAAKAGMRYRQVPGEPGAAA
jgi:aryl-alcohol dehydrogenase-like predicted oxidoreductase